MKSKIGFHVDIQGHRGQVEKMIQSETGIIKIISSMGMLRDLHAELGDKTVFVARDWNVGDDFLRFIGSDNPKSAAQRWMSGMRSSLVQAPFAYWESFNEMSNWGSMGAYGEFEAERQRLMAGEGFKACIGNFATGTPAISDQDDDGREDHWQGFYPALEVAHELGNILGLHEYGGLWMDLWYGPNQSAALRSGNRVPFPENRYEGWLFGRYRKVWRRHIEPNGWTNLRIAITEFGLDGAGTGDTDYLAGYPLGSWTSCAPAWKELDNRNDPAQFYVEQLQWCDRQMQRDPYMIGSTIFTWGTGSPFWAEWEIEGEVADKLIDHISNIENTDPPPPPDDPDIPSDPPFYVTPVPSQGLWVRSAPTVGSEAIVLVYPGDRLQALESKASIDSKLGVADEWLKVLTPDGSVGWSAAGFLEAAPLTFSWSAGHALVGLHGPADIGEWPWDDEAYQIIREGRIEAVKLLAAGDIGGNVVNRLSQEGVQFIMARLFAKFPVKRTPAEFVNEVSDAALRLYNNGIRYFEVHNEPNLHTHDAPEGMWVVWQNGQEFGEFYLEAVSLLRELMPDAQFGFPGVSPGFDVPNVRANSATFLAQADSAIRQSDFVCMHTYWGPGGKIWYESVNEIESFCNTYPDKLVFVTEFSNSSILISKEVKGMEYAQFYTEAKNLSTNLGGLFSFVLSASSGFEQETWKGSQIGLRVGMRSVDE